MLSECGGIAHAAHPGRTAYGYASAASSEALLVKYAEIIGAILDCETIAGFCYTQLTDTEQEMNGLLTEGRVPKADPDAIRVITRRPSRAVPYVTLAASAAGESVS
jgi:hypothetical protein